MSSPMLYIYTQLATKYIYIMIKVTISESLKFSYYNIFRPKLLV